MSYELIIVESAQIDVDCIYRYIADRSGRGADNWYRAFNECLARIVELPSSCSLATENSKFTFELRQAIFKTRRGDPYRCVFTLVNNQVRLLCVRGRGQPPLEISDVSLS